MDSFYVVLSSALSLILLFISTKIIGNKQMSELNMFDYINGITIGSIAGEMATSIEDVHFYVIAMGVYTLTIALIAFVSQKSLKFRRFLAGRALTLLHDGKIYKNNFKTAKIDMGEFLTQCRVNGYFNIDDIDTAIIEENGKISILPKTAARPVNTKDLNLLLKQEKSPVVVILDGEVLENNLAYSGHDREWLKSEMSRLCVQNVSDIFLAICNNNSLSTYARTDEAPKNDLFQ